MPRRSHSIVILGDINIDILGATQFWPEPGDDCQSPYLELHLGGVAANCAVAFANWCIHPRLVGCVGRDDFANFLRKSLRARALDTRWVQTTSAAMTGLCYINILPDGQRTFFGSRGSSRLIRKPAHPHVLFHRAAALHLFGYNFLDPVTESTARYLLKALRGRGALVSLDVGPEAGQRIPRKILRIAPQIDLLLANISEARALTGKRDPRLAFRKLLAAGARDVVLKLGKQGCLILHEGRLKKVPSFPVRAVDSTGAGDAFVAAFLQAKLRGWPALEAALAANAAGAAATTVMGAGENLPQLRKIARVLQTPFNDSAWDALRRAVLAKVQSLRQAKPPRASRSRL